MEKLNLKTEMNQALGKKAKHFIPGGAHTYSKGDDQFPANAPKIIARGKGAHVWDVDDNRFVDFGGALGSVTLGHAYEPVLAAVRDELEKGVNFSRPSLIEGELAEMLNEIIPAAEMVKFGKNGSDAVTGAVKLARAYTGRKYVARCNSDPFNAIHDWFIGSTVISRGVPEEVQRLTLKFDYNDLDSCQKLFDQYPGEIACFVFEPVSFAEPKPGFLQGLKDLCEKNGALLIFDEVVSGFRFDLGGVQKMIGVTPHLAAFGKAMANGFSVSALVGQREFMRIGGIDHDQERVFLLSTTYGGETHSLAAARTVIQELQKNNIIRHFWWVGEQIMKGVSQAARDVGAEKYVHTFGYSCKPGIAFKDEKGDVTMAVRTLILQETFARGVMMPIIVPSWAHREAEIGQLVDAVRDALAVVKAAAEGPGILSAIQRGQEAVVKPVFRKFN